MIAESLKYIALADDTLLPRQETGREITIPECIDKCRSTGRLRAFELKWRPGDPDKPHVYWDSDVAKVLEGMAWSLLRRPDPELEARLDRLDAQDEGLVDVADRGVGMRLVPPTVRVAVEAFSGAVRPRPGGVGEGVPVAAVDFLKGRLRERVAEHSAQGKRREFANTVVAAGVFADESRRLGVVQEA